MKEPRPLSPVRRATANYALAVLFCIQLCFPSTAIRWWFIAGYLALAVGILAFSPTHRRSFWGLVSTLPGSDRGR